MLSDVFVDVFRAPLHSFISILGKETDLYSIFFLLVAEVES
jgi:hypothetical protein